MITRNAIEAFDEFLESQQKSYEATIAGGAALQLLGVVSRLTQDVDMVRPDLDMEMRLLSMDFANQRKDLNLDVTWLNDAAKIFTNNLEEGWEDRTETVFNGKALKIKTLSRYDLLVTKVGSYLSRGEIDLEDCKALAPSEDSLDKAIDWVLGRQPEADKKEAAQQLDILREEVLSEREVDHEPER